MYVCVRKQSALYLSVGMNAGIRASVCMRLHACIRSRVYGYEVYVCGGYMPAYMCVYLNVPDFSYI